MSHFSLLTSVGLPTSEMTPAYSPEKATFAEKIEESVSQILSPYEANPADPAYLEFYNAEEEEQEEYETGTTRCIRYPDGTIRCSSDNDVRSAYCIWDGKVYAFSNKILGKLSGQSLSYKTPLIGFDVVPNYPFKALYKTFQDYLKDYGGYTYDEIENAYGEYYNPYAKFDYYAIGGRFPFSFLVPDSCKLIVQCGNDLFGNSNDNYRPYTPKGYKWVTGARKSDISWQTMKDSKLQQHLTIFNSLENWFLNNTIPNELNYLKRTHEGICNFDKLIYQKEKTLSNI